MAADDAGFIDAHNWLFTARGIPVLYYGSETGFMRGRAEHAGNRNYYGQARIDAAAQSPIFTPLQRIATLRRESPALQRGLQLNLKLEGDQAAFYRVYQRGDIAQTALVLLNKGDAAARIVVDDRVQAGVWREGFDGGAVAIEGHIDIDVPAHGVRVLLYDAPLQDPALLRALDQAMNAHRSPRRP
jgi:glycosidase